MALCGCPNGLVATALLAMLVLPAQYYVPEPAPAPAPAAAWPAPAPVPDLCAAAALLLLAAGVYLAEFLHRKLMERRIVKLNQFLRASVSRLRAWDAQQEQLERTLRLVQHARAEYDLLLYLLLRRRAPAPPAPPAPAPAPAACLFDKGRDEALSFLSPGVDT